MEELKRDLGEVVNPPNALQTNKGLANNSNKKVAILNFNITTGQGTQSNESVTKVIQKERKDSTL